MAQTAQTADYVSYADYVAIELQTQVKHEWLDGQVVAMAGGSIAHAKIIRNLLACLLPSSASRGCEVFTSELKVRVEETGLATYPDASVFCEPLCVHPEDKNAATNPTALFEVLSRSTESWDRGDKFEHYRSLTSLRTYVLIAQHAKRVEIYRRGEGERWTLDVLGPGGVAQVSGAELVVEALYEGVEIEAAPLRNPGVG